MKDLPKILSADSLDVEVHIVGPGYGECVVVTIGKRIVLGIDCCPLIVQENLVGDSYLGRILSNVSQDSYIFWLLTHYHFDHFQGLASLLERFGDRLQSIVIPHDYLPADFVHLLSLDAELETRTGSAYFQARNEYERLRSILANGGVVEVQGQRSGRGTWFKTRLKQRKTGKSIDVCATLDGLSPPKLAALVGDGLGKLVKNPVSAKKKRQLGNEGSYVLHLRVGDFDGVFLGDAPAIRTQTVDWNGLIGRDGDILLKVSHHGAADGTSEALLSKLEGKVNEKKKRTALVAPFKAHGLPRLSTIDQLKKFGFEVRVTGGKRRVGGRKIREVENLTRTLAHARVQSYQESSDSFVVEHFEFNEARKG